jgi:hypothetical protein
MGTGKHDTLFFVQAQAHDCREPACSLLAPCLLPACSVLPLHELPVHEICPAIRNGSSSDICHAYLSSMQ